MARFGSNIKMTVARELRQDTRAALERALGCTRQSPNDSIDLFTFDDGGSLAVDYVDAADALSPEQHKKSGTWLESDVADEAAAAAALEATPGVRAFTFVTEHRYFQLPGGQVFRLKR
jgi:hypothetical protein